MACGLGKNDLPALTKSKGAKTPSRLPTTPGEVQCSRNLRASQSRVESLADGWKSPVLDRHE